MATAAGAGCGAERGGAFAAGARAVAVAGSGFMILTAGVEAALGKSALVGLPVGIDGGSPATSPVDAGPAGGAFHKGAYRVTRPL